MARERAVDWDAETYDRVANPQEEWGRQVLARLELRGDETVLDAGCGSGRVTRLLLERLPAGRVIGVDASPSMVAKAREWLADDDRVELRVADLAELELAEPVDAIFSNATFHWIGDHRRLFEVLFACLAPGGPLEAQCGGEGNVAELVRNLEALQGDARFAPYLRGFRVNWNFASVEDTRTRLARAGFGEIECWLERRRVQPPEPRDFFRAGGPGSQLEYLPDELHETFIDAVLGSMPRPFTLEFVRLNISARRPKREKGL
jgi:trans-aconitate 2-methyltransferase